MDNAKHEQARAFLEKILEGDIGIPYHCLVEFLAIVTNARVFKTPTPAAIAIEQVRSLLLLPRTRVLVDSPESFETLASLLTRTSLSGGSVHDVRIASVCIENGVRVFYSLDRDFSRIPGITIQNPLL